MKIVNLMILKILWTIHEFKTILILVKNNYKYIIINPIGFNKIDASG